MKKFNFIILACFIWFMIPMVSKAYTNSDVQNFKTEFQEIYGNISDANAEVMIIEWQSSEKYMYSSATSTNYNIAFTTRSNAVSGDTLSLRNGDILYSDSISVWTSNNTPYRSTVSGSPSYSYMVHSWGTFSDWQSQHLDLSWTNVSYDANVPTPTIDVMLTINENEKAFNLPNTPMYGQLGPEIPYFLGFQGSPAYRDYYLYLDMTIWTPISGELKLDNGIYTFSPKGMYKTQDIAYYDWDDMYPAPYDDNHYYATNTNWLGVTLDTTQQENLNTWYNIRHNIELGNNDYPEMSYTTTLTGTAKDNGISRINQMLRNASLAGNRVRFRACLYYINENNEIKCGNFATWTSAQPSKPTTEQPSINAQVIDQPANGINQTVSYDNIISENENTSSIPPVNVTTGGSNVNVTVNTGNQNVPNNQNYPTVVSYNHDNIFTTFIGTYNSASQYLGGFAQFCNSCLLWIPSEIWSIIGMGFAMALVIMIIKIL